jgi:hypothetical protein
MQIKDLHWEHYIEKVENNSFHPSLKNIYSLFPDNIQAFPNLIFYGPAGAGKYSQMLYAIKKYSNNQLKYEKKLAIQISKNQKVTTENYFIKMSDVHFEIDFNLLGCNAKQLWNDIYTQIGEVVTSSSISNKKSIIVCKNFHNINSETLEIFYSYLQESYKSIRFSFILITNSINFIPVSILNLFKIIPVSKTNFLKGKIISIKEITDKLDVIVEDLYHEMIGRDHIHFNDIRTKLYNLLVFNHSLTDFVEKMSKKIVMSAKLSNNQGDSLIIANQRFLFYFQNNYRPIFHLESYFYTLLKIIHGL